MFFIQQMYEYQTITWTALKKVLEDEKFKIYEEDFKQTIRYLVDSTFSLPRRGLVSSTIIPSLIETIPSVRSATSMA